MNPSTQPEKYQTLKKSEVYQQIFEKYGTENATEIYKLIVEVDDFLGIKKDGP